ncbi:hypothetical protein [Fimbriiglobus ruber]|uniref:Uncharacterized protein n=1 Tax=Fimbriiglobus ruber TaxID=1908690 RepID=A0A225DFM7_9BACT|nr:hypothetical protein [Fimbriiglobus ruber]OWK35959.1 hypothetical protein FRUB_08522 [Fimbriiglobus ruber]
MALPTVPEWLAMRDGTLKSGVRDHTVLVMLTNQPQYRLEVRPANGKFACAVSQTNNGKRLDDTSTYPTPDAALTGGLEQLKNKLGW